MLVKTILYEDFTNYKSPCMFIGLPNCSFKCGKELCQNSPLALSPTISVDDNIIVTNYISNPITNAICLGGLEPFDSWDDIFHFIDKVRNEYNILDDIIIYSGYYLEEINDKINILKQFPNIIVKFGRYIPNQEPHFDDILGVNLISTNQYAERIS